MSTPHPSIKVRFRPNLSPTNAAPMAPKTAPTSYKAVMVLDSKRWRIGEDLGRSQRAGSQMSRRRLWRRRAVSLIVPCLHFQYRRFHSCPRRFRQYSCQSCQTLHRVLYVLLGKEGMKGNDKVGRCSTVKKAKVYVITHKEFYHISMPDCRYPTSPL